MNASRSSDDGALERLRRVRDDVERQIAEAVARGELDDLEGAGRPLPRDPDENAGDRWAAAHILRNAKAVPEWLDIRAEIFRERDALERRIRAHHEWLGARRAQLSRLPAEALLEHARATERADRRFHIDLATAIGELNRRIARHNLLVRPSVLQLAPLTVDRLRERAGAAPRA